MKVTVCGATDDSIFNWTQTHLAIVVTFDEGFADAWMCPCWFPRWRRSPAIWPTTTENTKIALARLFDSVAGRDCPVVS